MEQTVKPGVYRHFKGREYIVEDTLLDPYEQKRYVLYSRDGVRFVRSVENFQERVKTCEYKNFPECPPVCYSGRFEYIGPAAKDRYTITCKIKLDDSELEKLRAESQKPTTYNVWYYDTGEFSKAWKKKNEETRSHLCVRYPRRPLPCV